VGKPEEKRLLGRPRHRWLYNIRMDLGEQDRNGWRALEFGIEPSGSLKCWEPIEWPHI
jgi:hypothetical protein